MEIIKRGVNSWLYTTHSGQVRAWFVALCECWERVLAAILYLAIYGNCSAVCSVTRCVGTPSGHQSRPLVLGWIRVGYACRSIGRWKGGWLGREETAREGRRGRWGGSIKVDRGKEGGEKSRRGRRKNSWGIGEEGGIGEERRRTQSRRRKARKTRKRKKRKRK